MPESLVQRRMPELDFWRGLAIASVLLYHAIYWSCSSQPNRFAEWLTQSTVYGWLGVNLFFVLSGFLITGILLDSKGRPGYFRSFYGRRARRIIPAYLLCLVLLSLFQMVSIGGLLRAVTFTANYDLLPAARSYAPFWSLSVEEQFYLAWPAIVLLAGRRTLTGICLAVCLSEPLLRFIASVHGGGLYDGLIIHGTPFVADSLGLGALGALHFRSRWAGRGSSTLLSSGLALVACVVFLVGYPHGLLHRAHPIGAALQVVPFNLFFAAVIFASVGRKPQVLSGNITRPVRALGDISYGLYLYHLIVFSIYDRLLPAETYFGRFGALLVRALVCATASIVMAWISRWKFEEFFLRRKTAQQARSGALSASKTDARHRAPDEASPPPRLEPNANGEGV